MGKEEISTQKLKPTQPGPLTSGERVGAGGRNRVGEKITKEHGKENNTSESSNQEKNRDGFYFSQQPNALRR